MKYVLWIIMVWLLVSEATWAEDLTTCRRGWDATESGRHLEAVTLFNTCIETGNLSEPTLARTYRNIGIAYRRAGQPKKAIEAYDKAIARKPADVWDDYINRGNAYDEAGEFERALADYEKALSLRPDYGEAFYNRGITYEGRGQLDKAKADFRRAYDVGLRTRLLQERLEVHGLLNVPLPPPPTGYSWERCPDIGGALLKPDGWSFRQLSEGGRLAYFITKKPWTPPEPFDVGLTFQVLFGISEQLDITATEFARRFVSRAAETQRVERSWTNEMGPFQAEGIVYSGTGDSKGYKFFNLIIANDKTGTAYLALFEAPESSWEAEWQIIEPTIQQLMIDDAY